MNPKPHRSSLVVVDALGSEITVYADSPEHLRELQREYGRQGCRPKGEIPGGGIKLPLAQHDTFDWSLIGATTWTSPEGDKCVIYDGQVYKQRLLEEIDSKKLKLPPAIKYSRGAKDTDPPHVIEQGSGEFKYRTLIMFKGNAPVRPEFKLPGGRRHVHAVNTGREEQQPDAAD